MTARMSDNLGSGDVELDVTAEKDDLGVFLAVTISRADEIETAFECNTSDPDEIDAFFSMVAAALKQYDDLRAQA